MKIEDKIIVTNRSALVAKYGQPGMARIRRAVDALIRADRRRGLRTCIYYIDDTTTMKRFRAPAMQYVEDCRAAKEAIDAIHRKLQPDYLMILGAPDVVPHQNIANPAYDGTDVDDREAPGDIPYACDTDYSRDAAEFVGPTRVVGRLPDLTGETNPSHLLSLLRFAARWKSRPAHEYHRYFGLSTFTWQGSTKASLRKMFGENRSLLTAPPKGPRFAHGELGALAHFINCHGGPAAPEFYGQKGLREPRSLTTRATETEINEGTVASVECCYGADLYNSVILGKDVPICQSYLAQGAYGYFGSTTIAYGMDGKSSPTMAQADLLCQLFMSNVLEGASIGRAALTARQQFAEQCQQTDPIDLKTLAQFCLLGDPSVHPIIASFSKDHPGRREKHMVDCFRRRERRAKLKVTGDFLKQTKPTASKADKRARMSSVVQAKLAQIARQEGLPGEKKFTAYRVKNARRTAGGKVEAASAPTRYYLAISKIGPAKRKRRVAVIAKELHGHIVGHRVYHER